MNASNELREKMWELCYDLLPEGERSALIAQIKSDPQAARLYAEVRLQADLVGFAAKVEDPSLILSAAGENLKVSPVLPVERAGSSRPAPAGGGARSAWATWIPAAAALVLVGLIVGGVYAPFGPEQPLAQAVLEVDAPLEMPAGVSSSIVVRSRQTGAAGNPAAVPVDLKVLGADGLVRFQTVVETDANGVAAVELPGQAVVPGAQLRVESPPESLASDDFSTSGASDGANSDRANSDFLAAALPVTSAPPLVYYMFGTPVAQAGEEVQFAAIAVEPFTLQSKSPPIDWLVVKDATGTPIVEPMWQELDGVVQGTFELPPAVPDPSRLTAEGIAPFRARDRRSDEARYAAPLAENDLSKKGAAESDAAKDSTAKDAAQREPAAATPLRQKAQGDLDKVESLAASPEHYLFLQNESRAGSESLHERLERVEQESLTPLDRLQAEKNAQAQLDQMQRKLSVAEKQVVLPADKQVIEAGQPVEVEIPAELADKRIVADVTSRGVSVVRQVIEAPGPATGYESGKEVAQQKVTLHVPPEVDGELQLKLADASQSPAKVVREHYFFRQPARELKLQPQNLAARYDPGQVVSLKFQVVDENGTPAPASLGARVWREDVVPAREDLVMLADTVRQSQTSEVAQMDRRFGSRAQHSTPLSFGRAGAPLGASGPADDQLAAGGTAPPTASTAPTPPAPSPPEQGLAPVAGGGAAETQSATTAMGTQSGLGAAADHGEVAGADPLAGDYLADSRAVTLLVSNRAAVESKQQALAHEREQSRQAWQALVGRLLVIGGIGVLAGVGLLFLVRVPVRVGGGTLAIVAAAASLMVGMFWTGGQRPDQTIAMATGNAPQATPESAALPPRVNAYYDDRTAPLDAVPTALPEAVVPESAPAPSEEPPMLRAPAGRLDVPAAAPPAGPDATDMKANLAEGAKKPTDKAAGDVAGDESGLKSVTAATPAKEKADAAAAAEGARTQPSPGRAGGLGGGAGGFGSSAPRGGKSVRFAETKQLEDATAAAPNAPQPPALAGVPADAPAPPAPAPSTPAEQPVADAADRPLARGGAAASRDKLEIAATSAPASIYFNPRLTTDEQGFVTLEFRLPQVESEYRLLIDAFGNGRVGSSADLKIVSRKAE